MCVCVCVYIYILDGKSSRAEGIQIHIVPSQLQRNIPILFSQTRCQCFPLCMIMMIMYVNVHSWAHDPKIKCTRPSTSHITSHGTSLGKFRKNPAAGVTTFTVVWVSSMFCMIYIRNICPTMFRIMPPIEKWTIKAPSRSWNFYQLWVFWIDAEWPDHCGAWILVPVPGQCFEQYRARVLEGTLAVCLKPWGT